MAIDTYARVSELIEEFPVYLDAFLLEPPFNKPAQLENHLTTIRMRRSFEGAMDAVQNDEFLNSLYKTLQAWGIGMRGSKLKPFNEFCEGIRENAPDIAAMDKIEIDNSPISVSIGDGGNPSPLGEAKIV